MIQITHYQLSQASAVADLYHDAIHGIAENLYTARQREAWAQRRPIMSGGVNVYSE